MLAYNVQREARMVRTFKFLALLALASCGITPYQRFADYVQGARMELHSPAMTKAICEAGGVAPECPGNELPR